MMPLCDPLPSPRLASMPTATSRLVWHVSPQLLQLLLSTLVLFLMLTPQKGTCYSVYDEAPKGLVVISHKNFTAHNNRNLTIICKVNLKSRRNEASKNEAKPISFSTSSRIVLTFMTVPRNRIPLDQTQSFLHCHDPQRTNCWAEFNLDLSCLEEKMSKSYYYNQKTYLVEAVCQVDDNYVCNTDWLKRYPHDCWDTGHINVVRGKCTIKWTHIFVNANESWQHFTRALFVFQLIIFIFESDKCWALEVNIYICLSGNATWHVLIRLHLIERLCTLWSFSRTLKQPGSCLCCVICCCRCSTKKDAEKVQIWVLNVVYTLPSYIQIPVRIFKFLFVARRHKFCELFSLVIGNGGKIEHKDWHVSYGSYAFSFSMGVYFKLHFLSLSSLIFDFKNIFIRSQTSW